MLVQSSTPYARHEETATPTMTTPAVTVPKLTQLRPPPPFDNPGSWTAPVQTLHFCRWPLRSTAGGSAAFHALQARVVLATPLGDAKLKDIAAVKKAFTDRFIHSPDELYETTYFHCRAKQPGETADAFYTALRSLVKRCNYVSPKSEKRSSATALSSVCLTATS